MKRHEFKRIPCVPGVYDLLQCTRCGETRRCSPDDVAFGEYLPKGNVHGQFSPECSRALEEEVPAEFLSAYQALPSQAELKAMLPENLRSLWPSVSVGNWGTPAILIKGEWRLGLCGGAGVFHPCWVEIQGLRGLRKPRYLVSPDRVIHAFGSFGALYPLKDKDILEQLEPLVPFAMVLYNLPDPSTKDRVFKWFGSDYSTDLAGLLDHCVQVAGGDLA